MKLIDPTIALEKYQFLSDIKQRIQKQDWIDAIESRSDRFIWLEDTPGGKSTMASIDSIPEKFREKVERLHNRTEACAEFNQKKGVFDMKLGYLESYGALYSSFEKTITKQDLRLMLSIADELGAYVLNNGNQIIDKEFIENYKG